MNWKFLSGALLYVCTSISPALAGPSCPNGGDAYIMQCNSLQTRGASTHAISISRRGFGDGSIQSYGVFIVTTHPDGKTDIDDYIAQGSIWFPANDPFHLEFGASSILKASGWQFEANTWCPSVYKGMGTLAIDGIEESLSCESYVYH